MLKVKKTLPSFLRDKYSERSKDCFHAKKKGKIKGKLLIKVILLKNQIVIPGKHAEEIQISKNVTSK